MEKDTARILFGIDVDAATWTQKEVSEITELSPVMMQNWANRRLITLQDPRPGLGQRRLYRPIDIIKLRLMVHLTRLGVSATAATDTAAASELLAAVDLRIKEMAKEDRGAAFTESFIALAARAATARIDWKDGKRRVRIFRNDAKTVVYQSFSDALRPDPKFYIHIDIDQVILEVLGTLHKRALREIEEAAPKEQDQ